MAGDFRAGHATQEFIGGLPGGGGIQGLGLQSVLLWQGRQLSGASDLLKILSGQYAMCTFIGDGFRVLGSGVLTVQGLGFQAVLTGDRALRIEGAP